MANLEYRVDSAIFEAHPGYKRGVVVVHGASNCLSNAELIALLREEEEQLRIRLHGCNVADHPAIASWRDAYRRFGARPSEYRSSIEAMVRRVVKPEPLPSINALVDIGNIVSLRHMLPAGVHPLPTRGGISVALRHSETGDMFLPIGSDEAESPAVGEVVFCEGQNVLTRRWTWRQAAGTQTQADASAVFFNIDGLPPVPDYAVQAAMHDIRELVRTFVGGAVVIGGVICADKPALEILYS